MTRSQTARPRYRLGSALLFEQGRSRREDEGTMPPEVRGDLVVVAVLGLTGAVCFFAYRSGRRRLSRTIRYSIIALYGRCVWLSPIPDRRGMLTSP